MDSNSDSISLQSLSVPISVISETKQKFDSLLKGTLKNTAKRNMKKFKGTNSTQSKENLLLEMETFDDNEQEEVIQQTENYLLNKFLNDSINNEESNELISVNVKENQDNINVIKPPVPKPRKKYANVLDNASSISSGGTFNVTSPKILTKVDDNSSNKTYNISPKQHSKNLLTSDVIVHNSPMGKTITKNKNNTNNNKNNLIENGEELNDTSVVIATKKDVVKLLNKNTKCDEEKGQDNIELEEFSNNNKNNESSEIQSYKSEEKLLVEIEKPTKITSINENTIDDNNKQIVYNYEKIVEILIHKTDRLLLNSLVIHPLVKICLVDLKTGEYLLKSDRNRSVVFFYENNQYDYISSVMTHAYNLQEKRTLIPCWNETILLNEDYDYFINNANKMIIFFEILDFVSFSEVNSRTHQKGWHQIAFAFLKPITKTGLSNLNKLLRLQLYYYPSNNVNIINKKHEKSQNCYVWNCWKEKNLTKYPSTLYITIKSVISPEKVMATFRSKTPIQSEKSGSILNFTANQNDGLVVEDNIKCESTDSVKQKQFVQNVSHNLWAKSLHESCKLPNKCMGRLDSYDKGCFTLKFSWNGLYLACGLCSNDLFLIVVYSVRTLEEVHKFPYHQGLIYNIRWSKDDKLLLCASADNTVSIWNFETRTFLQILPHPSFVYCCDITSDNTLIATGCYDNTLRLWIKNDNNNKKIEFNLNQELENHRGYITSICFNNKSTLLYSSDSIGVVIEWSKENEYWKLNREITLLDLKDVIINSIHLFPNEKRILINSRDNIIRIADLKSFCVLNWLLGCQNNKVHVFSTISPCGNFILSGSENGSVNIWNAKNGNKLGVYEPYTLPSLTIHCTEFHPLDNIIAISHYGDNFPILLYSYEKNLKDNNDEIVLKLNHSAEEDLNRKLENYGKLGNKVCNIKSTSDHSKLNFKTILEKMDEIITLHNSENNIVLNNQKKINVNY